MNRKKIIRLIVLILVCICFIIGVILAVQINNRQREEQKTKNKNQPQQTQDEQMRAQAQAKAQTGAEIVKQYNLRPGEDVSISAIKYTDLPKNIFADNFKWHQPVSTTNLGVFTIQTSGCAQKDIEDNSDIFPGCIKYRDADQIYYSVASFNFKNKIGEVLVVAIHPTTYGNYLREYKFIKFDGEIYLLNKESELLTALDGLNKNKFLVDQKNTLPISTFEKIIDVPEKQKIYFVEKGKVNEFILGLGLLTPIKVATYKNQNIYDYGDYLVTFTENIIGINPLKYNTRLPKQFIIAKIKIATNEYYHTNFSKCGNLTGTDVVRESDHYTAANLEKIGMTDNGQEVYKPKDTTDGSEISELFKINNGYNSNTNLVTISYDKLTVSYDKFLASYPILIMKDGFGRYIRFTKKNIMLKESNVEKKLTKIIS